MAHAKNKKSISRHSKPSSKLHTSKLRFSFYPDSPAKKIILTIIILVFCIVIVALLCSFFLNNERVTKANLDSLASDYYENHFFENLKNSNQVDLEAALKKYETYGSAPVTLRQLLIYAKQNNINYSKNLTEYCDENLTYVRFYPNPPYSKTSYHAEYSYSCNF